MSHEARHRHRRGRRFGHRRARCERGQAVAEFALVLPLLMVLFMGMVELGYAYDRVHGLAAISREGANIAARGTPLAETLDAAVLNGQSLGVSTSGGVIASRIVVTDGIAVVDEQVATDGFEEDSRLAQPDYPADLVTEVGYRDGSTLYAVEVFLVYRPITPVGNFLESLLPDFLYERAVF